MLKIITTLTLVLFGLLAKGQDTENRIVSDFSKVEVKNGIELIYNEANQASLKIDSEANLKNVCTEMKGKTLKIFLKETVDWKPVRVYLSANNVSSFVADSNAKISIRNQVNATHLKVILKEGTFSGNIQSEGQVNLIAGSGTLFSGHINADTFKGFFKDDAKINLSGAGKTAIFQARDKALCNAKNFLAQDIHVNATGNANVKVHADKAMRVTVEEEAKVTYTGFPSKTEINQEAESFTLYDHSHLLSLN